MSQFPMKMDKPSNNAEEHNDVQLQKKGRHRKKQLYNSILQQMEFYFSDSNLAKDRFLTQLISMDPYVELSTFLKFNKIRRLTLNIEDIQKAVSKSELLELSEDKTKIRRKTAVKIRENEEDCTIYVERIKSDATHEWLSSVFSEFGTVVYVSIPKYKHNHMNKGFAFIEYECEADAQKALSYFESIGCKIKSELPPEELQSIATFQAETMGTELETNKEGENISTDNDEKLQKKRKLSDEETDGNVEKRTKMDSEKKNKKSAKKKSYLKEMGFQVLSKREWKKLRNRYLNMQRQKMKELKQHLYRSRFAQTVAEESSKANEDAKSVDPIKPLSTKLEFTTGVIVQLELPEPCTDVKKTKAELKAHSEDIKFVDVHIGSAEVFIRFANNDSAIKFCSSEFAATKTLLTGEEEKSYWNKIHQEQSNKAKKQKPKQRGREKLLKKAEKEFNRHTRFDNLD